MGIWMQKGLPKHLCFGPRKIFPLFTIAVLYILVGWLLHCLVTDADIDLSFPVAFFTWNKYEKGKHILPRTLPKICLRLGEESDTLTHYDRFVFVTELWGYFTVESNSTTI